MSKFARNKTARRILTPNTDTMIKANISVCPESKNLQTQIVHTTQRNRTEQDEAEL